MLCWPHTLEWSGMNIMWLLFVLQLLSLDNQKNARKCIKTLQTHMTNAPSVHKTVNTNNVSVLGIVWFVTHALIDGRRAQLRRCLDQLKQQVPLSVDTSRHTTLSLLHRARQHIKVSPRNSAFHQLWRLAVVLARKVSLFMSST